MADIPRLSPKLHLTADLGYALHYSRQPDFRREWHTHDCGMLLWPRMGSLRTAWDDRAGEGDVPHTATLARGTAVLLPTATTHLTVSQPGRQQHGELYLPPERLRGCRQFGAIHLDAATLAMLEALLTPTLAASSGALLVRAIVEQILAGAPLALPEEPASVALRMVRRFVAALERDAPLPSIDGVASELGVSIRQLQRACQLEFGASPVAVRRRVLATHARTLINEGRTLASVSVQLGFASSGHLGRLLREVAPDR
ncbi:AraC-type DNA-binding protein [Cupriavidus sp. YR651]|uniref:AraC family transcriptional regulator n=1 Tax=Cupriavidus sp. YR651 TaxID=1855315 RepID=UPI0008863DC4|nr:helix-turn-helix domain-containing protein [Cupriavidus sp. YR651]SDC71994.1 AraC-type DNA-binding protein [Cupriavidus sp. YR651]